MVDKEVEEKMSRILGWTSIFIVALAIALMPAVGLTQQEHGGKEHGGAGTAAPTQEHGGAATAPATQQPAAPAAPEPAPAAPQPAPAAPPALKPIVITFTGDLVSVDTKATPAMITVKDRYGVSKEIGVPSEAKISQGTSSKGLADLKTGDKLTVEYTYDVAMGKRTAQMISVGEAAPAPTS
jgi:pyruvate/2-oxoglutarate dehydrogenase complex dihydrolipoamide acyltransferase (E2) component